MSKLEKIQKVLDSLDPDKFRCILCGRYVHINHRSGDEQNICRACRFHCGNVDILKQIVEDHSEFLND